ncbi:hypothetical protein FRACYDRAFT_233149 [Fragilariopsis cylindrus CCMP1102]|uniref:RRM domain-containing protein n=1 Tax=Fragilariopsis cylindrus CCMP1102 TaxID=635003 RepID=A0A1E7FXX0_9STRA|nr:hypothetical protein FRACYDRAFT_233149 [Fragilariopsis cylindrus CCMP1102]|eukprot:OEU22985.1 hypothetical protein FRACYDRAFT_233149 [Fragilariopsis cylindrus CCMP1102]
MKDTRCSSNNNNRIRTYNDGVDIPIPRKKIRRTESHSSPSPSPSPSRKRRISDTRTSASASASTSTSPSTFKSLYAKVKAISEKELDGKQKVEEQERQLEKLGTEIVKQQQQQSPGSKSKPYRLIKYPTYSGCLDYYNSSNRNLHRNNNSNNNDHNNGPRRFSENTTAPNNNNNNNNNEISDIPPLPSLGVVHCAFDNNDDANKDHIGIEKKAATQIYCDTNGHTEGNCWKKNPEKIPANVSNRYVYVTNIATDATKSEFLQFLEKMISHTSHRTKYPNIIRCKYDMSKSSKSNATNFNEAYVEFETPQEASSAIMMQNRNLKGRDMSIKYLPQNNRFPQDDNDNGTSDRSCPLSPPAAAVAGLPRNDNNGNIVAVTDRGDDDDNKNDKNNDIEGIKNNDNNTNSSEGNNDYSCPPTSPSGSDLRNDAGDNNGDGDDSNAIRDIRNNANEIHSKNEKKSQKRPLKKRSFSNYFPTPAPPSGNDSTVTIASTTVVAIDNDNPPAHNDDNINRSNSDMSMSDDDDDGSDGENEKEDGQIQTDDEELAIDGKDSYINCSDDQIPCNGERKETEESSSSSQGQKRPRPRCRPRPRTSRPPTVFAIDDIHVAAPPEDPTTTTTTTTLSSASHNNNTNFEINRFKELKSKYESAESEISGLKTSCTDTITDLDLTKRKVCALTIKLSLSELRYNEDVKQWKKRYDDEVTGKEQFINDLRSEHQHEKKGMEDQLNELQLKFDDVDVKKDNISKILEESERFVVDTKNTHEAAMKKVIKSNKNLQNELTKNKKDLQDSKTSYKFLKTEKDSLVRNNNDLNGKLQQRNGELKDHRCIRIKLEEKNNSYESDIEDLKNENRVCKQRFEESESRLERLIKQSIKKDDRINDHEKTIKEIKKELKEASTKLQVQIAVKDDNNSNNNENDIINSLQESLSQLERGKVQLLMNCNRASSAYFEEKNKCDEKDKIIEQLQKAKIKNEH